MKRSFLVIAWGYVCLSLILVASAEARRYGDNNSPGSREGSVSALPICLDKDRRPIQGNNNEEVLKWKDTTKNQYLDRALIVGKFVGVLLDRQSHLQIEVDLGQGGNGQGKKDSIEIIYNKEFGAIPGIRPGATIAACGDYITSREQAGRYPPSPAGAIVHWVHASNNPEKHPSGFVAVDGVVYGNAGDANKGPKN